MDDHTSSFLMVLFQFYSILLLDTRRVTCGERKKQAKGEKDVTVSPVWWNNFCCPWNYRFQNVTPKL